MANTMNMQYLSQEDIIKAGCFDLENAVSVVEGALRAYDAGRILYPDKTVQIFDEETQSRINCLPATLLDKKVCGMKWVSVFPANPSVGLQNVSAVILLSSIETGFPIAFMEGTLCSNMRTAAVSATAAKYLARKDSKEIGFIGAGEQAKMHFVALKAVLPSLSVCRVSSRTEEREQTFIRDLRKLYPDVEFVACHSSYEMAATGADIIVTAISGQAPLLHGAWIKKGAFYTHVAGWEDDDETVLKADKIVCDCWQVVKHRAQTLSRMYKAGTLHDEDIYCDLPDLVTGKVPGRESDDEFIYFNAVGLSYVDVSLAYDVYEKCQGKTGRTLPLQDKALFSHDLRPTGKDGTFII